MLKKTALAFYRYNNRKTWNQLSTDMEFIVGNDVRNAETGN